MSVVWSVEEGISSVDEANGEGVASRVVEESDATSVSEDFPDDSALGKIPSEMERSFALLMGNAIFK